MKLNEYTEGYVDDLVKYGTTGQGQSETINAPKMTGWICPVCGRGLSPYTYVCPRKGWEVTCRER